MKQGKSKWAVAALLGLTATIPLGCDDDESTKADVTPYVGAWGVSGGNLALVCFGNSMPQTLSGNLVITDKGDGVLQLSFADSTLAGCNMLLDAGAASASVQKGQTCAFAADGFLGTLNIDSGSLVKSGETAVFSLRGNVLGNYNNIPIMCTANFSGTLTRGGIPLGNDGGTVDSMAKD
ncbi:MAG: hypothetical protein SGI86_21210 [Deltaproteobacteria bacterium]|nr:hypothetical protein [Deltaproteobacteria bacterium]